MKKKLARNILLNPGPVTTTLSVKSALLVPDVCHREKVFSEVIRDVQAGLKQIVNAGDEYSTVLFSDSGTGTLESVITSAVPLKKKIAIISNGVYGDRMIAIARANKINCVPLCFPFDQRPAADKIAEVLDRDKQIAAVAIVHHETSTGMLNPLSELGDMIFNQRRIFIVDAVSSMGGVNIDIQKDKIDFLVATANKCLQGMPGVAFVIARNDCLESCQNNARSYYLNLYAQYEYLKNKGQLRFTPPVQVVYALRQAIHELFQEGILNRIARYRSNFACLSRGLQNLGFKWFIPPEFQAELLAFVQYPLARKKIEFLYLHDYLFKQGFIIYPTVLPFENALRLACIGDLSEKDIKHFLRHLEKAILQI